MVAKRIEDRARLRLIKQWRTAGVLDTDGQSLPWTRSRVRHSVTGTPQGGRQYTSYNVAKNVVEFSTSIPRDQLRPGYGVGFMGAPLTMVKPDDIPTERERGGRHGTSRTEHDQGAGGQRHV